MNRKSLLGHNCDWYILNATWPYVRFCAHESYSICKILFLQLFNLQNIEIREVRWVYLREDIFRLSIILRICKTENGKETVYQNQNHTSGNTKERQGLIKEASEENSPKPTSLSRSRFSFLTWMEMLLSKLNTCRNIKDIFHHASGKNQAE